MWCVTNWGKDRQELQRILNTPDVVSVLLTQGDYS
jgi:hypothetical protein